MDETQIKEKRDLAYDTVKMYVANDWELKEEWEKEMREKQANNSWEDDTEQYLWERYLVYNPPPKELNKEEKKQEEERQKQMHEETERYIAMMEAEFPLLMCDDPEEQ